MSQSIKITFCTAVAVAAMAGVFIQPVTASVGMSLVDDQQLAAMRGKVDCTCQTGSCSGSSGDSSGSDCYFSSGQCKGKCTSWCQNQDRNWKECLHGGTGDCKNCDEASEITKCDQTGQPKWKAVVDSCQGLELECDCDFTQEGYCA